MRVALASLLVFSVAACDGGGTPINVLLTVVNESAYSGTFNWVSPGPFGLPLFPATGSDNITGCSSYRRSFGVGQNSVSINVNSKTFTFEMDGVDRVDVQRYIVIDPSGQAAEAALDAIPTKGCGHL